MVVIDILSSLILWALYAVFAAKSIRSNLRPRVHILPAWLMFLWTYGGWKDSRQFDGYSPTLQHLIRLHDNRTLDIRDTQPTIDMLARSGSNMESDCCDGREILLLEYFTFRDEGAASVYSGPGSCIPKVWWEEPPPIWGFARTAGEARRRSRQVQGLMTTLSPIALFIALRDPLKHVFTPWTSPIDFIHPYLRLDWHGDLIDSLPDVAKTSVSWSEGAVQTRSWDEVVVRRFQSAQSLGEFLMHPLVRSGYRHELAGAQDYVATAVDARFVGNVVRGYMLVLFCIVALLAETCHRSDDCSSEPVRQVKVRFKGDLKGFQKKEPQRADTFINDPARFRAGSSTGEQ